LHRAIIRRTYFGIYFAIEPGVTTVVAMLDMRNDPRVIRSLLYLRRPKKPGLMFKKPDIDTTGDGAKAALSS
jgi:hypothetical protein